MFKNFRRNIRKMFRELLVYNYSSLEYRAKIITLIISSNGEISKCEKEKLQAVAKIIYSKDENRAELLVDTVKEYHSKIMTNNGLDFEHLVQIVVKETKAVKRFSKKINLELLSTFNDCLDEKNEDDILYRKRIFEFLEEIKNAHISNNTLGLY